MNNKPIKRSEPFMPFWGLSNIHRDIDSLFESVWKPVRLEKNFDFAPACDIEETETHYQVSVDLPGVKKEDIHLEVKDNMLMISGEKKDERKTTEGKRHITERYYGSFSRAFTLPSQVASDKVEAMFKEGVLQVSVPKAENAKSKKISIS